MNTATYNVALAAPSWLGDAVMSLPVVGFLSASSRVRLTVLSTEYTARVYAGIDATDELIVLGKKGRSRSVLSRAAEIARLRLQAGLLLAPSFSSALALRLARVPVRVGYRSDGRRPLLSDSLPGRGLRREHLQENYLRLGRLLLSKLGVNQPSAWDTPALRVFESERELVTRTLRDAGLSGPDYVVVVPGATYGPTKSWPHDKYAALVRRLARDVPVILAGGHGEHALCEAIVGGVQGAVNLAGRTTLGELFALLAGARTLVANDSGAPHAAAALGVPVVVVFGSTSPVWTRPMGERVEVIRHPVPCAPCFRRECPTQLECYAGITVDEVYTTALRMLSTAATSSA